ncbi:MAG: transposase [Planctomycetia bacterium]|nr:transposase [Planctomycetia bacterium]
MFTFPQAAEPLISAFSIAFSRRTFQRVGVLILGAILSLRRRTITAMLGAVGPAARGHWSDFHRVFSRAAWSPWTLGRVLAGLILERIPAEQPGVIPVDDTAVQHKGKRVYGKGRHYDAIRSTHGHTVWVWGHKWVTVAINVKFPFASRPWALPVLCALYRPEELNRAEGRRHKTPIRLTMQLVAALIHWFPRRTFILVGDGGDASHELARFCHRHRRHVTLVSRFHADANLYDPPSANGAREHRSDVSGSARASGLYHSAQLVQAKRAAHGAVFAWFVQSRQSDLCATWPPARHETHRAPVVRQDGHQFQRRDHRGPSIVLGNGFERVAESCGYHKTSETFTPHTAGSPEPGRVRPGKDGKSRAKRRSPFSHANVILPDDSGLSARRRVRIRARE